MRTSTAKSFFSSKIHFDLGELPARYIDRGCRGIGVLVGLVALFVAISMGSALMSTPFDGGRSPEWWIMAILVFGGCAVFVVALLDVYYHAGAGSRRGASAARARYALG